MAPQRPDQIVGRNAELDELDRLFRKARLVTVTGPPGIGKSALAAGYVAGMRPDRKKSPAVLVSLTGATSLDAVCRELARALRLPASPGATPPAAAALVARALAHRGRLLVVLDDADAARAALAKAVPSWLAEAPLAAFLVTTRARLGVAAEARLDLGPLEVPRASETDLAAIARADAVRLFVKRAAALRPGYQLPRSAARSVANIVRRVEGVPLAVELCAARITILAEREIEELLSAQVGLLSSPSASRSLGTAIAWSWDQLEEEDAELLARCSVFRGSFDLTAAALVAAGDGHDEARIATIEGLTRLEAASLLRVVEGAPEAASRRYAVPETIRLYAREQLAHRGEAGELAARHARHYGSLARRAPRLGLEELALERENLEAAYETATANDAPVLAAHVLVALRPLVLGRGPLGPYLKRIDALVERKGLSPGDLAELHLARGLARVFRGQRDDALEDLAEARRLAKRGELHAVDVLAASKSGMVLGLRGEVRAARKLLDEALVRADRLRDSLLQGIVRKDLANVLSEQGEDEQAFVQLSQARDLFHAAGDAREEGFVLMMAATRLFDQGQLDDARRDLVSALALLHDVGDARSETWTRAILALVDLETGDHRAARVGLEHAIERVRLVGDEHTEGLLRTFLGHVSLEQGLLAEAEASYRDARRLLAKAHDRGGEALATAAAGFTEAELGRFAVARASMDRAAQLLSSDARPARAKAVELLTLGVRLREARARGEGETKARTAVVQALSTRGAPPPEEVRFAQRLLRRALEPGAAAARANELLVARDGGWVKLPASSSVVELGRTRALRRLVLRLANERLRYPGRPVSPQALVAAGWPGERILPAAAKNRLHVTVARLRRLGLGAVLLHGDEGYLLDAAIPMRLADDPAVSVSDD